MPVEGMTKGTNCPVCGRRVNQIYTNGAWVWPAHMTKKGGSVRCMKKG